MGAEQEDSMKQLGMILAVLGGYAVGVATGSDGFVALEMIRRADLELVAACGMLAVLAGAQTLAYN